jgi:hypothetical protein
VLVAKQSHFLGETPADLGVAAIGEKFNKNGALNLQYRKKLIKEAGNHWVPHRSRQANGGTRESRADLLRNRNRLVGPTGHVGVLLTARRASPVAGVLAVLRRRRLARNFWQYIAVVRAAVPHYSLLDNFLSSAIENVVQIRIACHYVSTDIADSRQNQWYVCLNHESCVVPI